MKQILLGIICILCSFKTFAVSYEEAQIVFNQLTHKANYYSHLQYDSSLEINAYSSGLNIIITQGMLNFCETKTDLLMVLGHELGHYIHRDYLRHKQSKEFEISADRYGYYYCRQMSPQGHCLNFMRKMYYKFGVDTDDIHPSWPQRIKYVKERYYV